MNESNKKSDFEILTTVIEYVLSQEFVHYKAARAMSINLPGHGFKANQEYLTAVEKRRKEIESLAPEEQIQLYRHTEAKENESNTHKYEKMIARLPHNLPSAKPDLSFWNSIPKINVLNEGVPLLVEITPELTNIETMTQFATHDPKASQYVKYHFLITRLLEIGELQLMEKFSTVVKKLKSLGQKLMPNIERAVGLNLVQYEPKKRKEYILNLLPAAIVRAQETFKHTKKEFAQIIFDLGEEKNLWSKGDLKIGMIERELSEKWSTEIKPQIYNKRR